MVAFILDLLKIGGQMSGCTAHPWKPGVVAVQHKPKYKEESGLVKQYLLRRTIRSIPTGGSDYRCHCDGRICSA
jgi:hypothetical protein